MCVCLCAPLSLHTIPPPALPLLLPYHNPLALWGPLPPLCTPHPEAVHVEVPTCTMESPLLLKMTLRTAEHADEVGHEGPMAHSCVLSSTWTHNLWMYDGMATSCDVCCWVVV